MFFCCFFKEVKRPLSETAWVEGSLAISVCRHAPQFKVKALPGGLVGMEQTLWLGLLFVRPVLSAGRCEPVTPRVFLCGPVDPRTHSPENPAPLPAAPQPFPALVRAPWLPMPVRCPGSHLHPHPCHWMSLALRFTNSLHGVRSLLCNFCFYLIDV